MLLRRAKAAAPVQDGCAVASSSSQGPSSTLRSTTLRPTVTSIRPSSSLLSPALPPTPTSLRSLSVEHLPVLDDPTSLPDRPTPLTAQVAQAATPTHRRSSRSSVSPETDEVSPTSLASRPSFSAKVPQAAALTHGLAASPNEPPLIGNRPSNSVPERPTPSAPDLRPVTRTQAVSLPTKRPSLGTGTKPRTGKGRLRERYIA